VGSAQRIGVSGCLDQRHRRPASPIEQIDQLASQVPFDVSIAAAGRVRHLRGMWRTTNTDPSGAGLQPRKRPSSEDHLVTARLGSTGTPCTLAAVVSSPEYTGFGSVRVDQAPGPSNARRHSRSQNALCHRAIVEAGLYPCSFSSMPDQAAAVADSIPRLAAASLHALESPERVMVWLVPRPVSSVPGAGPSQYLPLPLRSV